MTNTHEEHQIWLAAMRTDRATANSICREHGSPSGSFGSIPQHRLGAALIAMQKLANGGAQASHTSRPKTLDDIREDAFAKFNNPKVMQRNAT